MRMLVTGGGGFLGRYIVEQLVSRGDNVHIFSRKQYPELKKLGVKTVQGDIRDADAITKAAAGIDAVFHVAAVPGVWGAWKMFHSINTVGTENVIAACRKNSVSRLIFTSSPSVIYDGKPHENGNETLPYPPEKSYLCHYPHSKALAEKAVLAANDTNLATVALRPHLIWGPRDNHLIPRLIQRALSGRLRRVGTGENLVSISYVENAAAAHLMAADVLSPSSPVAGEAYFINEPEPVNLWNWIDELLLAAELPAVQKQISAKAAWRIGALLEKTYKLFRLSAEPPMTRFIASQLSSSHYYNTAKAKQDFNYAPLTSHSTAMEKTIPELQKLVTKTIKG